MRRAARWMPSGRRGYSDTSIRVTTTPDWCMSSHWRELPLAWQIGTRQVGSELSTSRMLGPPAPPRSWRLSQSASIRDLRQALVYGVPGGYGLFLVGSDTRWHTPASAGRVDARGSVTLTAVAWITRLAGANRDRRQPPAEFIGAIGSWSLRSVLRPTW